jgi:hypothetical protein
MNRTIKAIERHMRVPARSTPPGEFQAPSRSSKLVGEWQQHGPETLSGYALRKLRLTLVPAQSVVVASAAG